MRQDFSDIFMNLSEWLGGSGVESDIVVSSRARLARNISGNDFVRLMDVDRRKDLLERIEAVLVETGVVELDRIIRVDSLDRLERTVLVERHLISRDMASAEGVRSVAVSGNEAVSVMIIEEDHLRIQVLKSGLDLHGAFRMANDIDDTIESRLPFAFHPEFGYLTACPTNVGTGLRVSVMLHLPALVITGHIDKVVQAGSQMQLAVRGIYGEGTEPLGQFFQISNQVTLGRSEKEILERLDAVIPQIIRYENNARQTLMIKDRRRLEDRVWRAFGQLKYARSMSSEEVMMLLSHLRLGVQLGLLPPVDAGLINEMIIRTQPAHLQVFEGGEMTSDKRDAARADYIREKLESLN